MSYGLPGDLFTGFCEIMDEQSRRSPAQTPAPRRFPRRAATARRWPAPGRPGSGGEYTLVSVPALDGG